MNIVIILGLIVSIASSEMTMKKYKECIIKEEGSGITCDKNC